MFHCRNKFAWLLVALSLPVGATGNHSSTLKPQSQDGARTYACPLTAAAVAQNNVPVANLDVPHDKTCLVDAGTALHGDAVFDLRPRPDFVEFHLPDAQSASLSELVVRPGIAGQEIVVYDSGRVPADAYMICSRLRRAGIARARIINGGIVAWAEMHGLPEAFQLGRVSDAEAAALLLDQTNVVTVLASPLRPIVDEFRHKAASARPSSDGRILVLADPNTPVSELQAKLRATPRTTLYWVGSTENLRVLLSAKLAMDKKREAGPAESDRCSAL